LTDWISPVCVKLQGDLMTVDMTCLDQMVDRRNVS